MNSIQIEKLEGKKLQIQWLLVDEVLNYENPIIYVKLIYGILNEISQMTEAFWPGG